MGLCSMPSRRDLFWQAMSAISKIRYGIQWDRAMKWDKINI
jgi:hypothetical protein